MKKILSTVLVAAMLAGTFALGAVGVSAKELELQPNDKALQGQFKGTGECGFIDGNLYFTTSLSVDKLEDIKIEVNGKPAYWNIGYMGYKHCQLGAANDLPNSWLQLGIVGAELTKDGENTLTLTAGGDTYTQKFSSGVAARGVAYSQVVADKIAKTVDVTIIYNENPGYKVGDELTGKCHDDHDNTGTFKVTKVDGNTITLKAENYVPAQSLLELADKNGVYTTVTINYVSQVKVSDPQALSADDTKAVVDSNSKQDLTNVTSKATATGENFSDATKLNDGTPDTKIEGIFPSGGVTVTFETSEAVKGTYLVLYTNDEHKFPNRAAQAFTLYGSVDGTDGSYKVIKDVINSGIKGEEKTPFAFALKDAPAYKYYKLEIKSVIGGNFFQLSEIALYTGDVKLTGEVPSEESRVESQGTENSFNGTAPTGEQTPPTQNGGEQTPPQNNGGEQNPPATGDIALILSVIALIAVAGAVVIAKRRKIEN